LHNIKVVHKFVSIYKPKSPHKMKKFFAFALVASMMTLAACSGNKSEATSTDSLTVDSSASAVVDSASAVVDSAATMAPDTTKK
jgi:hypothetical protein